jgi:hypothetical protein
MNENRRQILEMLAAGKINADEAERLIAALESGPATTVGEHSGSVAGAATATVKTRAKYLRVLVEAPQEVTGLKGPTSVNVRVPMQLLRAGVRLAGLIPAQALHKANDALREQGVPIDLSQVKPENLQELVEQLHDLSVDVDAPEKDGKVNVRAFCE